MNHKFKVGDKIIGKYSHTSHEGIGVIIKIHSFSKEIHRYDVSRNINEPPFTYFYENELRLNISPMDLFLELLK